MGNINKKWKVLDSIGEGGLGQVFKVQDVKAGDQYIFALKRLKNVDNPERRQRFEREVEAIRQLKHPNILRIVDFDLSCNEPYYVGEYCEKLSLDKIGAAQFRGNIREVLRILRPIAGALVCAHQHEPSIFHRDVKPGNILLRRDGSPVLGDFGICYIENCECVTLSGDAVGSRNYIAPEMQSGGRAQPDNRTDVYSLGKVFYWMLSGGHIFARENHRDPSNSLVSRLGQQRFEHVHELFDHMIVETQENRLNSNQILEEFQMTERLVEGNFAPLKPSVGILCRFCGKGTYEEHARLTPGQQLKPVEQMDRLRQLGIPDSGIASYQCSVLVLRCNHCGHHQLFTQEALQAPEWWDA